MHLYFFEETRPNFLLEYDIVVSEFELQSRYYIHF